MVTTHVKIKKTYKIDQDHHDVATNTGSAHSKNMHLPRPPTSMIIPSPISRDPSTSTSQHTKTETYRTLQQIYNNHVAPSNSRPTCLPTIALPTESQCQGVRGNYSYLHTDKPQATGPANICRLHDDASTKGRKCHLRPIKEHFNQGFLLAWTSRRGGNTTSPNASQDGAYRNFAVACFSQSAITW